MARKKNIIRIGAVLTVVVVVAIALNRRRGSPEPYNVLLITLDTTRADRIGCYGYPQALTPRIDELSKTGVVFERAISNVPLTLPSHTTLLTGLYPPEHGIRTNGLQRLDPQIPTLADTLHQRGYKTGAFIAAYVLDSRFGLDRGFDRYDADMSRAYVDEGAETLSVCRPGNTVVDAALNWLDTKPAGPFFCWVHLFDAHHPYHAHTELNGTQLGGQESYDAQIAFLDIQVGRLMAWLKQHDLARRTLIIVVGDHGEGLGDHGEKAHGYMLYNTTVHVPLIVSLPDLIRKGTRASISAAMVDLYPTITDLLGFKAAAGGSGRSLKPVLMGQSMDDVPCYSETDLPYTAFGWSPLRSLTTQQWKYVRSAHPELYDVQADPQEQSNRASEHPQLLASLEKDLTLIEDSMKLHAAKPGAMTNDEQRRLESLGYVAGRTKDTSRRNLDYSKLRDMKDMMLVADMAVDLGSITRRGQIAQAIEVCRKMVQLSPDSARVRCYMGAALLHGDKPVEAQAEFEEALRIDPELDAVHEGLGECFTAQKKTGEAIVHFKKSLDLNPNNDEAHTHLAVALASQGQLDEAVVHFREATRLRPGDDKPHFNYAKALLQQGKIDEAVPRFQEALRINPRNEQTHCNLGMALMAQGKHAEARSQFTAALEINPNSDESQNCFGIFLAGQGKLLDAMEHWTKAVQINPGNAEAQNHLGNGLMTQNKLEAAAEHFTAALNSNPEDEKAHYGLAVTLARQQKLPEAKMHCEQVLRLNPANIEARNTLGIILSLEGRMDQAIAAYRESLRLDPNNMQARKLLDAALAEMENTGTQPETKGRNAR